MAANLTEENPPAGSQNGVSPGADNVHIKLCH
jgi:hypothetical protein